jgi:crotonobetainyl-CoA:carnitine CoA-transferase CaiB-like acyl-CoA transferase
MLSPYRILDCTDHRGEIAGMVLGDLGAEVIRIEPPEGSESRRRGPLLASGAAEERSLEFHAFNRNKRGITVDLSTDPDRETFFRLVTASNVVLTSSPDGLLDDAQIGFEDLCDANPHIVHVVVTPYGSDGPYADYAAADLTLAAMGGPVSVQGTPDRPPVRVSVPQVWRHTGVEAAIATLVGLAKMQRSGAAQLVDVSAQAAMTWTMLNAMDAAAIQGHDFERSGSDLQLGLLTLPLVFPCADGYVAALTNGSVMDRMVHWLVDAGLVPAAWAEDEDWRSYDRRLLGGEPVAHTPEETIGAMAQFLARETKEQLMQRGLAEGVTIAPANTVQDVLEFSHLATREYWHETETADGQRLRTAGLFARLSETPLVIRRDAPRLGEHNGEIRQALADGTMPPADPQAFETGPTDDLPLAGLKVADFSWVGVGPITAKYLADHGATVVRVEAEMPPDILRAAGPYKDGVPGTNRSQFYGDFNTSKLGMTIDLKNPAGLGLAKQLIGWADVMIESFTAGTVADLGIGYDVVRELNPSIVMASTCLMGQTGPAAAFAGYGYHAGAVAGFYDVTGWPDRPPDGPWVAYTDTIAPRFLAATLMAAIDHRRRTGQGQHIDGAQIEMALHFLAPELLDFQASGRRATRIGNRAVDMAPQGVYRCAGEDQWCAIAVESDEQWQALRVALESPEWAGASEYETTEGRLRGHDAIDVGISEWTADQTPHDAMARLAAAGVPAGAVQRSSDLLKDVQYRHREFYHWMDHGEMGHIPYAGHQFRIAGYDSGPRTPAPLLGEHNLHVLQEVLGLGEAEIAELYSAGALG